jgi:hypothetical protein
MPAPPPAKPPGRRTPSPKPAAASHQQLAGRAQAVRQPSPRPRPNGGGGSTNLVEALLADPDTQLLLFYVVVVGMGAYVLMRLIRAALFFGPLLGFALVWLKPEVAGFEEALRLLGKKQDDAHAASTGASGATASGDQGQQQQQQQGRAGWLMNLITRTSAMLQRNPVRDWVYFDALFFIVAKKKDAADTVALGVAKHWVMLDPTRLGDWPWNPRLHSYFSFLARSLPAEFWRPFPSSASPTSVAARQLQQSGYGVDAFLSAAVNTAGSVLTATASPAGSPRSSPSSPRSPRRHGHHHHGHRGGGGGRSPPGSPRRGDSERPIREWMRQAQALAERGRFVDAGAKVEEGLARCRGSLKNGAEEEMELLIVGAAFYEAAQTSPQASTAGGGGFLGRLRCLQQAAELAAQQKRWARAAELLDEASQAWYDEKRKGSPFGLVASGKAAPLVLGAILSQLMFGDHVKATQIFRMACAADRATAPGFPRTPEGGLASAILEAMTRSHDGKALREAHAKYKAKQGHALDGWQEEAVELLRCRLESGAHLR